MEYREQILGKENETVSKEHAGSPQHALKSSGHYTCDYPNGLSCGVRFEAIPGTRGVHVDVVHVLDLRKAEFGKSGLAMRAAILEAVNRPLQSILSDIGLIERLEERTVPTPFGKVSLPLLDSLSGSGSSLIHETRTMYVVREDTRTSLDLSWLTDSSRVIAASDFSLARRSDMRAMLPSLREKIDASKWSLLETSVRNGWLGVIALLGMIVGLAAVILVFAIGSGNLLVPLLTLAGSACIGGMLLSSAKKSIDEFKQILASEEENLAHLGDRKSIDQSIADNEEQLRLLGDISFVVSPLMAVVGLAIESGDMDEAARNACQVLDECVRLSPSALEKKRDGKAVGDEGLRRFLDLFEILGAKVTEEDLALAYVGLTGHLSSSLSFSELVSHIETLNNTLFNAGILRPDVKESIDDRINRRAMKAVIDAFDKSAGGFNNESELTDSKDAPSPVEDDTMNPHSEVVSPDFLTEIRDSRANESIESNASEEDAEDEEPVVIAQTVAEIGERMDLPSAAGVMSSRKKKPRKDDDHLVQSSLFDTVSELMELGNDSAGREEEGGPAGA